MKSEEMITKENVMEKIGWAIVGSIMTLLLLKLFNIL